MQFSIILNPFSFFSSSFSNLEVNILNTQPENVIRMHHLYTTGIIQAKKSKHLYGLILVISSFIDHFELSLYEKSSVIFKILAYSVSHAKKINIMLYWNDVGGNKDRNLILGFL